MLLNTAQVFLFTSFLCPKAVETDCGGKIINSFTTLELTPELHEREALKRKLHEYNMQNKFIHKLGHIKMFASGAISPFVIDYYNSATSISPNNRVLLSVCYGVESTFSVFCKFPGLKSINCIVQPFVHFYPNRTVTILYSCYLIDKKPTKDANILRAIKILKQAYLKNQPAIEITPSRELTLSEKTDSIHSFCSLTEYIKEKIRKSIPEYDLSPDCPFFTHSLVRFIQGSGGDKFGKSDFERICAAILPPYRFIPEKIAGKDIRDYWDKRHFDFSYISEHESISIDNSCFSFLNIRRKKYSRYCGWRLFAEIELALQEKLLFEYMKNKAQSISQYILDARRFKNKGSIKLNIFDPKFEKIISQFFNSTLYTKLNSHARMIIYRVYGSKESRKDYVQDVQSAVSKALEDSKDYESIYKRISKPFGALLNLLSKLFL